MYIYVPLPTTGTHLSLYCAYYLPVLFARMVGWDKTGLSLSVTHILGNMYLYVPITKGALGSTELGILDNKHKQGLTELSDTSSPAHHHCS